MKSPILLPPKTSAKSRPGISFVTLPQRPAPSRPDDVLIKPRAAGIGAQVHYLPVYRHVYYEKLGYREGLCPNAESFAASEISLPIYPGLSAANQARVARTLKQVIAGL